MLKKSISALIVAFALVGGIFTASANAGSLVNNIRQDKMQGDKMQSKMMHKKKKHKKMRGKMKHKMSSGKMSR